MLDGHTIQLEFARAPIRIRKDINSNPSRRDFFTFPSLAHLEVQKVNKIREKDSESCKIIGLIVVRLIGII